MGKLGFYYDNSRCTGCRACQIMCKDTNNLPVGVIYRRVRSYEQGNYPNPGYYHFSWNCNHCENPACVSVCPVGAMHVADDGTVQPNDELCIGCRSCASACPYEIPQLREEEALIGKCDSCKDIRAQGGKPACVDACVMRCLDFGDLDELKQTYGSDLVSELAILPSAKETGPSLLINPRQCALEADFEEKII